ncbi:vWA domain-containing protein [Nannocystis radixulma]|uniref:VWA domain-containing protein n=1 Tax=Nannocystis radixulma TaxID=2995305 RepID=A0ABT5BML4_9BACT|nr:vWA domain-containing protein [Nannocystis radixulma]MDC0674196.1 VWA domain-containing protein [Nannocystis radixulma]
MLVLDKSGSMLNMWDHDADPNTPTVRRWYSLYVAVNQALTDFNDELNFGMSLFPSKSALNNYNGEACLVNEDVEVPSAEFNKNAIIAALPDQNSLTIEGTTPTARGMTAALTYLKSLSPAIPRAVVLVTDGAANCSTSAVNNLQLFEAYDDNLAPLVNEAFVLDKISTWVIGIAIVNATTNLAMDGSPNGINPYEKLNELATLGGTAQVGNEKFYGVSNAIDLSSAFSNVLHAIDEQTQTCVVALDVSPIFPDKAVVKLGNVEVPRIVDCANEDGWRYVEPSPYMALELCGTACTELKLLGEADVEYGCDAD